MNYQILKIPLALQGHKDKITRELQAISPPKYKKEPSKCKKEPLKIAIDCNVKACSMLQI